MIQGASDLPAVRFAGQDITLNNRHVAMVPPVQDMQVGAALRILHESLPDFVQLAESYGQCRMRVDILEISSNHGARRLPTRRTGVHGYPR